MTFLTRNFDPLTPLAPKFRNFAVQNIAFFCMKHCCHRHTCTCATKFFTPLGYEVLLAKNNVYDQNWRGGWARGKFKNFGPLTYFCNRWSEQLQIWYKTLVWDYLTKKRRFVPKLAGDWVRGASKTIWDPYLFLQPLKLATSNWVYNLGLGLSYQKTTFKDQNWRRPGPGEHLQKCGTPYLFLKPLKLATEKLVHNMSSGLPCHTQVLGPN